MNAAKQAKEADEKLYRERSERHHIWNKALEAGYTMNELFAMTPNLPTEAEIAERAKHGKHVLDK